jgi:Vault protein inter-alpha-trypsin domain
LDRTIAHTTLTQSFENISDEDIPEAHYTFPLYDGAVVTSFQCTIGNDQVLEGCVKPKEEAKKEFKNAIEKGKVAALLEEYTPEIFETAIGNIPAGEVVKVEITYVNELKIVIMERKKSEGLAVIIPMSIAPRYGELPKGYVTRRDMEGKGLEIVVKMNDNGQVEGFDAESGHRVDWSRSAVVETTEVDSFADLAKGTGKETTKGTTQYVWRY